MKNLIIMLISLIFLGAQIVLSEDAEKNKSSEKTTLSAGKSVIEISDEQRKLMAERHERMANCLRSDKPLKTCRTETMGSEMMRGYSHMMWGEDCPMMNEGNMMKSKNMMKNR